MVLSVASYHIEHAFPLTGFLWLGSAVRYIST